MENAHELNSTQCLNCRAIVKGSFCNQCGQTLRNNKDRSISKLLGNFLSNVFFLDNRFLISMWYLFRFPSRMTLEFLEGKRKKFIPPVTLFLFLNLVYFFVSPLTDYSIPLEDQNSQPYGKWVNEWVNLKLQNKGLNELAYSSIYQNASDTISKSIMIINVPMIAVLLYLMSFKKRRFYYDSLIFSFHFFSLFMASWIMLDWADTFINFLAGHDDSIVAAISFVMFAFAFPLLYAILGMKKFMALRWYWAIPAGVGVMIAVSLANLCYRFIIFILSLWFT